MFSNTSEFFTAFVLSFIFPYNFIRCSYLFYLCYSFIVCLSCSIKSHSYFSAFCICLRNLYTCFFLSFHLFFLFLKYMTSCLSFLISPSILLFLKGSDFPPHIFSFLLAKFFRNIYTGSCSFLLCFSQLYRYCYLYYRFIKVLP